MGKPNPNCLAGLISIAVLPSSQERSSLHLLFDELTHSDRYLAMNSACHPHPPGLHQIIRTYVTCCIRIRMCLVPYQSSYPSIQA
ncbi:hypothetical protein VTN00DRAFT_1209 [Thermoascus crustaceus]|uniref:uncharacterized protein n=1 Tax=Thermoascus crustaceus TaxID=5088 RepID=UPI0037423B96